MVPKSHFSEHVKAMHKDRDSGFEREYLVCLCANVLSLMSCEPPNYISILPLLSSVIKRSLLLQTIENVPDGVMDIAKAHRSKNRYLNIHTCELCNPVVCRAATNSHTCVFYCLFLQLMLQGLFCLCQMWKEVTTSMPHTLMYVYM